MAIQVALAAAAAPAWDFPVLLAKAKALGFHGLELAETASVLLADPADTARQAKDAGLAIAALTTTISLHAKDAAAFDQARDLTRRAIDTAAALGASCVTLLGYEVPRGESRSDVITRIGQRLGQLAELAAQANVNLALQNGGSFLSAKEVWMICEVANHPRAGVCWNPAQAARINEQPALSVPTLNTRIHYGRTWDAAVATPNTPVQMGKGEIRNKAFLERLRGIGYAGWVAYAPAYTPPLAAAALEADLDAAADALRIWGGHKSLHPAPEPPPEAKPAPKPAAAAPAKPAAAAAPKPATPAAPAAAPKPAAETPAPPAVAPATPPAATPPTTPPATGEKSA